MNFEFSAEQEAFRTELRKFLERECPLELGRLLLDDAAVHNARRDSVWSGLAQLGVTSLMLPEEAGGFGGGAMELCVAAEEAGRRLAPVPLVSTMYLAVQALLLCDDPLQRLPWLRAAAAGRAGCLVAPLDAALDGTHEKNLDDLPWPLTWQDGALHGTADLVIGGALAQWAVVLAKSPGGGLMLVAAELEGPCLKRQPLASRDPGVYPAAFEFKGLPAQPLTLHAQPAQVLARLRNRAAVLLAFEQLGAAERALEQAVAYARERRTFGRTIGSYQSIKHRLASLYTDIQMARVHCYFGAWALASDASQACAELARAAAAARLSAGRALTRMAQENLHVHGGMGYTWEMDCHLFYRRARAQAAILGHDMQWGEQLAADLERSLKPAGADSSMRRPSPAAHNASSASMDFSDTPEEAAFRAEVRAWLDAHAQPKRRADDYFEPHLSADERMLHARRWQALKASAGYGAITWPREMGGRGGSPMQELIWRQEEGRYNVPSGFFNVSLGMVLPSIIAHASPQLLAEHVAPALSGEHLWCQLLSEPGAGSDLGMLRTRAQRCEDGREGWILNGQKVWTSLAQFAEYGLVLARTDPSLAKLEGLTTFYIDMKSPGVSVRPIRQASGESEFNEVFLQDVFVPDTQRIGPVGGGWKITLTGLMSERLSIGGVMPAGLWRLVAELLSEAKFLGQSALRDGRMRERLADLYLSEQALWLLQCRAQTALSRGKMPGPEMSGAKNIAAAALQAVSAFALDMLGTRGALSVDELGERFALIDRLWWGSAGMRIAGGTDEIVLNSIGERVLGLEPEPRTDKGVPFNQIKS